MATQPVAEPPQQAAPDVPEELAVRLESFEGPLDLLLELIRKHEVDIFDIPIALITEEYLGYVERMEKLDLHVGGEWLEMAATLIYIKSKMLLPDDETDDEEDGPDPREELVRRLIEYQKYKLIAGKLDALPKLDHDVFTHRPQAEEFEKLTGPPELREAGLGDLVSAIRRLVDKGEDNADWVVEMSREQLTLRSVMLDIATLLQDCPRVTFEALFAEHEFTRYRVVTTFLALLEMTKRKIIKLMQSRIDGDHLYIERAVIDIVEVSQSLDLPDSPEAQGHTDV
ncbi:MAG: segregation and condensation protein A [Persicimonas sp.]